MGNINKKERNFSEKFRQGRINFNGFHRAEPEQWPFQYSITPSYKIADDVTTRSYPDLKRKEPNHGK